MYKARHGTARHGTARHGTARHGTARHIMERPSTILILCALLLDVQFCSGEVSPKHAQCNRVCLKRIWRCLGCRFDKSGFKLDQCHRDVNKCLNKCSKMFGKGNISDVPKKGKKKLGWGGIDVTD
ncbi:hypothetical protein LSAT2_023691 [Lamellibrachia satsuma]|nr:hypothetical protein LSAT2_023691 [Lamellibrachia satsuma]